MTSKSAVNTFLVANIKNYFTIKHSFNSYSFYQFSWLVGKSFMLRELLPQNHGTDYLARSLYAKWKAQKGVKIEMRLAFTGIYLLLLFMADTKQIWKQKEIKLY